MKIPGKLLMKMPFILSLAAVFSCITIENEIWLQSDGSGKAVVKFYIPPKLFKNESIRKNLSGKLALTPEAFRRKYSRIPGIKIHDIKEYYTKNQVKVMQVKMSFKRISLLSDSAVEYILKEKDGFSVLTVLVKRQKRKRATGSREMQIDQFIQNSLKRYQLKYTFHFPSKISSTLNMVLAGKRDAKWDIPFNEIYSLGKPLKGVVIFRKEPSLWDKIVNLIRYPWL